MCGRYSLGELEDNQIRLRFDAEWYDQPSVWRARFNVAPGQDAPVICWSARQNARVVSMMHWGLIPSWAQDRKIAFKMINARSETVREKPAYRKLFSSRRAIVPADAFYEWKTVAGKKHPMRIVRRAAPADLPEGTASDSAANSAADSAPNSAAGRALALAGLWDQWKAPDGTLVRSFTVITTDHNEFMSSVHDRMPALLLDRASEKAWLSPETSDDDAHALLAPAREDFLRMFEVSTELNNARNEGAQLALPVSARTG